MDPRNLMHVACSSCAWFIVNLNTNISLFTDPILRYLHIRWDSCQPSPFFFVTRFLLTWRTSFLARGANTHHSCPWFVINCPPFAASPIQTHPIDQVTIFTHSKQHHQPSLSDTSHTYELVPKSLWKLYDEICEQFSNLAAYRNRYCGRPSQYLLSGTLL